MCLFILKLHVEFQRTIDSLIYVQNTVPIRAQVDKLLPRMSINS